MLTYAALSANLHIEHVPDIARAAASPDVRMSTNLLAIRAGLYGCQSAGAPRFLVKSLMFSCERASPLIVVRGAQFLPTHGFDFACQNGADRGCDRPADHIAVLHGLKAAEDRGQSDAHLRTTIQ